MAAESDDVLSLDDLQDLTDQDLLDRFIRQGKTFRIDFALGSLGSTGDPSDIASDYMDALYFGEQLAKFSSSIDATTIHGKNHSFVRFTLIPTNAPQLLAELRRIVPGFTFDDEPDMDIRDEVADFDDAIFEAKLRLPDLADKYMANFLNGTSYTENTEYWNERYPMLRLGYWRSFASHSAACEFYTSDQAEAAWIVLGNRDAAERLLAKYGGFSAAAAKLHGGLSVRLNNFPQIVATPNVAVQVSAQRFDNALACVRRYIAPSLVDRRSEPQAKWERFLERPRFEWDRWYGFSWATTEDGDAIVCGNEEISFVAFNQATNRLRPEAVGHLLAETEQATDVFRGLLGLNSAPLKWNALTPDRFEDLCYDVLLRVGRFDERTFRRHGKTKSRDGGRDIEVWTLPRLNEPSEKWIFQCKFITSGSALSGAKVTIADVVDQYGAKGFGVMTNEVIDSTLYDKLDAIADRRKIGRDTWDGQRLLRFLSGRRDLMERYFPATAPAI